MHESTDEDLTETFKALSHPLRQDIIMILAESYHEGIGFSSLQRELNDNNLGKKIQVGTIYHHVKLLRDLIDQSKSSKWTLSEKGWFAYNLLSSSQDRSKLIIKNELEKKSVFSSFFKILAPPEIFFYIKKSPISYFGWQIVFFMLFGFIASESNLVLLLVFFSDLSEQNLFFSVVSIWLSWLIFSTLAIIVAKQLLKRKKIVKDDIITLMIFIGISMIPLMVFPIMIYMSIFSLHQEILPLAIVIILQLYVILLVTRGISVHFFIRMERSAIVGLVTVYFMMIIGLILGF